MDRSFITSSIGTPRARAVASTSARGNSVPRRRRWLPAHILPGCHIDQTIPKHRLTISIGAVLYRLGLISITRINRQRHVLLTGFRALSYRQRTIHHLIAKATQLVAVLYRHLTVILSPLLREEAEQYLIHRLEQLRQQRVYGVRRTRIWREAATRYLVEFADQPSAWLTATYLEQLDPYIGDLPLTHIDDDSLEPYVQHRRKAGISHRTINIALERVIRILNVCARKWRDEERRPWLDTVPMITKLDEKKAKRLPYPMSWEE